ncbi:hypothetical protein BN8_05237 [Fibrisoma limi BUZ 3]|uniref:Outer membrane protein beta-barrel domain-containing protein n=1 Tax=Fibrisoma limi BUZ 3 TaxID=1185876 RepID=I2GPV9_9BACT|nr:hypothetical protein [Fibrisoma limi]CCH55937.1 hypothetical protein BN8_05237 [Fibrisoma limi BUZ 3]
MKTRLLILFLSVLASGVWAQDYAPTRLAVGVRLGEPGGVMLRHYFRNDRNALELNFGTYGAFWDNDRAYRNGYFKNIGWAANLLYLWRTDIGSSRNWQLYYGLGGQVNNRRYYRVQEVTLPTGQRGPAEVYVRNVALGATGTFGLEYFVDRGYKPLSIFAEIGAYTELVPAVLHTHVQGGAGARLNF